MESIFPTWLNEPPIPDDTYAERRESTLKWLSRSTTLRAIECRRFLNENVSKLPSENQTQIKHDLDKRFKSAFFELIVARLLQEWGAVVNIEQSNSDGKKPDFTAQFAEDQVIVEAKSPIIDGDAIEKSIQHTPLLNYIESKIPEGWSVGVYELPQIGGSESQKEFKRAVDKMLGVPFPFTGSNALELIEKTSNGNIRIYLCPKIPDSSKLMWEASLVATDDTKQRIRHAIKSKKRQIRNSEAPVLLAIEAGLISNIEDFDIALFGSSFNSYDHHHKLIEKGFLSTGEFAKNIARDVPPTYAGVLAFLGVSFAHCVPPILYLNPRFTGKLPKEILRLEQRSYDKSQNRICIQDETASVKESINRLNFVSI